MAADWLFVFEAYKEIGVSLGMIINYCGPIIVIALSKVLFHEKITLQLFFTCITVVVFVAIKRGLIIRIQSENYLPIIWLGVINTGVCCYLYFSSISKLPMQTVAICGYLEPMSAVIMSFIILHEHMGVMQIIGSVLIISGAIWNVGTRD